MLIALGGFWGVRGEGKHGFATCAKIAIFLIGIEIWTPEKCPGGDNERINLFLRAKRKIVFRLISLVMPSSV